MVASRILAVLAMPVLLIACGGGATVPTPTSTTDTSVPVPRTSSAAAAAATFPVPTGDAQLLAALRVAPENDPGAYNRDAFAYPEAGTDSRGCNTRARVLQRDSTAPAQVDYPGCKVLAGRWVDSFTGTTYEKPDEVSIDHLVPLKEAYRSGASSWSTQTLVAFGNDVSRLEALKVIGGAGNASKGDRDPALWKPPLQSAWADYARAWLTVKIAYGLTGDQAEVDALQTMVTPPPQALPTPASPATPQPQPLPTPATPAPALLRPSSTAPATTRAPATTGAPATTATTSSVSQVVTPGAFCAPAGARGVTSTGRAMVCTTTATDSRNRWRAA